MEDWTLIKAEYSSGNGYLFDVIRFNLWDTRSYSLFSINYGRKSYFHFNVLWLIRYEYNKFDKKTCKACAEMDEPFCTCDK